MKVILLTI